MREPEILPGTFCEKMKSAWKGVEVKDTFLPGTFCEKKKSALKGAEVKNTFFEVKSAWKGAEVKDTFLPGTFMKSSVPNSSDGLIFVKRHAKDMFPGTN